MTASGPTVTSLQRATDRPGDASPFALGLLLRRAHDRAAAALVEALRPSGLELRHFAAMIALVEHGSMSQRELADALLGDKASMVRVIDDLEDKGLVRREPVPGDRRMNSIVLTERGLSVFDEVHLAAAPIHEQLVSHLRPGEADHLLDVLTRFTHPDL